MTGACAMKGLGHMASVSPLRFNLTEILADGLEVSRDVTAADLDLRADDARLEGPLHVSATLHREDPCVLVTGLLGGMAVRQCVRCLRAFTEPLVVSFSAEYTKKASKPAAAGRAKAPKTPPRTAPDVEEETEGYELVGEQVDLAPMLREQVILAEPMQPICQDECRGLCPVCGQDRNTADCRCEASVEGTLAEKLRAAQQQRGRQPE